MLRDFEGQRRLHVALSSGPSGGVVITISDTGPGIDDAIRDRI